MADNTTSDLQELLSFVFDGSTIRTLPATDERPELLAATDLCALLGHSDPSAAVRDNCEPDEWIKMSLVSAGRSDSDWTSAVPGRGAQTMLMVTETGAWNLVFVSEVQGARRVRKWLAREVMPAIRRQGYYATPDVERHIRANAEAAKALWTLEGLSRNRRQAEEIKSGRRDLPYPGYQADKRIREIQREQERVAEAAVDRMRESVPDALPRELGGTADNV